MRMGVFNLPHPHFGFRYPGPAQVIEPYSLLRLHKCGVQRLLQLNDFLSPTRSDQSGQNNWAVSLCRRWICQHLERSMGKRTLEATDYGTITFIVIHCYILMGILRLRLKSFGRPGANLNPLNAYIRSVIVCLDISQLLCLYSHPQKWRLEAEIWSRFDHPNIAPFYGICFNLGPPSAPCLVCPYFKNGNIAEYLKQSPDADRTKLVGSVYIFVCYS